MDRIEIIKRIENNNKKIKELEEENKELLLKIDSSNAEDKVYTIEDKVKIYSSLFKGREDVYAYYAENKNDSNKKYYIPACLNEWKYGVCNKTCGKSCKECLNRINSPLDLNVIKNHMYNGKTIGIYPLLDDDTCYFLAFDFDNKKDNKYIEEDVLAFVSICKKYQVPYSIEKSRSGKGIHIWIFFNINIKAITARKLGTLLLSKTMEIRDTLTIDSFDRMFPNQDYLPTGGYGNLIALPFQTEPSKYGNTIFIDDNFIPIKNQIEYLENVKKMSEEDVFNVIKKLSSENIDITNFDLTYKSKKDIKLPKTVNVILDNMIYIDKANLSSSAKNYLKRLATFCNPEFYRKQRYRLPVYNTPMIIDCSHENEKYLKLPRGTMDNFYSVCHDYNVVLKIIDNRNNGNKLDLKFKGKLKSEQNKALENLIKYDCGILHAPTGFGKTVVCCKLIVERNVNTLIITPTIQLLEQWIERIKQFINIDEIGSISSGRKKKITNKIDIACLKSVYNNGKFIDEVKNYGMVIIDECHHLAAYTYELATNEFNSKYVYGVTATPDRENGHTPIIKMQCGDVRYEVDFKKFNKDLKLPMNVFVRRMHLSNVDENINNYTINEINNYISKDNIRNNKIVDDVITEFKNKKNILVLTERLELIDYFYEQLKEYKDNILIYKGGMGKKEKTKYDSIKQQLNESNKNKIIIATGSYIGEGFDDSSLDSLFLTMPISGITKVIQYTGRLHRKNKNKTEINVYDYVDDNFKQTRNMFNKRKKTYENLGYEIIMDNITWL